MNAPRIKLRLGYGAPMVPGPGKADLLRVIARHGSISAAGRQMGTSCKHARSLVETLSGAFARPVVDSSRSGPGGRTIVTATGQEVLRRRGSLERLVTDAGAADLAAIGALVKRGNDA